MNKILIFVVIHIMLVNNSFSSSIEDVTLVADEIHYDHKNYILNAKGSVNITDKSRSIFADEMIYSDQNMIEAFGNIYFKEKNNHFFANQLIYNSKVKTGNIDDLSIRYSDNSLLAAKSGLLYDRKYILTNAVYSSCKICSNKPPQWQVKAREVIYDDDKKDIIYKSANLELYGHKIIYLPYFSHRTDNSSAKTGFLKPKLINISKLGRSIELPFYYRIATNKELAISPVISASNRILWKFYYNQLTENALYKNNFSFLKNKNDQRYRGHLALKSDIDFSNNIKLGYDIKKSSDKTYLKTYKFSEEDHLKSTAFINYNDNRNYVSSKAIAFQSLNDFYRNDNNIFLFPKITSHFDNKNRENHYLFMDNDFTSNYNSNYIRLINNIGYKTRYYSDHGHIFELTNSLRADFYNMEGNQSNRVIPNIKLDWQYPMYGNYNNSNIYLKPIANLIYNHSKNIDLNNSVIDNLYIEISDDNLFQENKYLGLDRIEQGLRSNYGFNLLIDNNLFGRIDLVLGQSYRRQKINYDNKYLYESGLYGKLSDYVGKISYIPNSELSLSYRYRIDKSNLSIKKNELELDYKYNDSGVIMEYVTIGDSVYFDKLNLDKKQIHIETYYDINKEWIVGLSTRKNLSKNNKKMISAGSNLKYRSDCMEINYLISKDFTRNREQKKNSISYFATISLKNITN